jgi:hypothetical protein
MLRGVVVVLLLTILCAYAEPKHRRALSGSRQAKAARCYVQLSGTAVPQPLERLSAHPSTAIPMDIIGELPRCESQTKPRAR